MGILFTKKDKKKEVSWGKKWVWKEGEEERTRIKASNWKRKRNERKERRQTMSLQRDEIAQKDWDAKQTVWAFEILKDQRVAKYIIYACTTSKNAHNLLLLFLRSIGVDTNDRGLPQMLQDFRENDGLALDKFTESDLECLLFFFRVKVIREKFASPGQDVSATDTDEEANAKKAAKALQEGTPAKSFAGLPEALQAVVASFTGRRGERELEAVRTRLGLDAADDHTTEDESTASLYPNSASPSSSEKSHHSNNHQEEVMPTGEGAVGRESAKRQKTESR